MIASVAAHPTPAGPVTSAEPIALPVSADAPELVPVSGAPLPTARTLMVGLGGVLIGFAGAWLPELLLVLPAYLAAALVALTLDWRTSTPPSALRVARRHELIFALGAPNPVRIVATNRGPRPLESLWRDEYPESFAAGARLLAAELPPGQTVTLTYRLTPPRRGEYRFGRLNLRYPSRLGLWLRQVSFDYAPAAGREGVAPGTVRVYPNLREVAKYELLARRGLTQAIGLRNARRLGEGTEFERLRDYVPDDEYRRIDWKATARRGKLIAREYETERNQHVLIVLDVGRLMNVRVAPLLKLDWAVNAALMLAWIALGRGDHVALLTFGAEVRTYLPPRRGRRHFQTMLERLYAVQPELAEPDFDAAFRYLARRNPKRSLVVVFTDLVDPEVSRLLVRYLARLVPHHVAVCVVIDDPAISALAEAPIRRPEDVWQRAIARNLLAERREVLAQLNRGGVITIDTPADKLNAALINRYLELKARSAI